MVALLGENTLLLMRPGDRGQLVPQLLEQVENLPRQTKPGLTKATVTSGPNNKGQVQLQLPGGQTFLAKLPAPLPEGSTLLLQIPKDGKNPQVLRVMLPPEGGRSQTLQPTNSPSVLMAVAKQSAPKVGEQITLKPFTPPKLQAGQQTKASPPRLPTAGAQVMGNILSPPSGGTQTLLLASGTPLKVINPPVFETGTNLTLRVTGSSQAVVEKITPPQSGRSQPIPQAPEGREGAQKISYPTTQRPAPKAAPQGQVPQKAPGAKQAVIMRLQPLAPVPAQSRPHAPQSATVTAVEKNTITLKLDNGLQLKVQPIRGEQAGSARHPGQNAGQYTQRQSTPPQSPQAGQQAGVQQEQAALLTAGSKMSVRFSENGLLDVMQVAQPTRLGPHPKYGQDRQGGQQSGQQGGQSEGREATANQPKFSGGHIATGTVSQQKPDGRLVLTFERGVTVEVQAQRLLPVGSKLSIQIMPDGHAEIIDMSLPKGSERSNVLMRLAVAWEGLEKAIEGLGKENPDAQQKAINALPRANENLLPQLIRFSQAVAQQNLQAFFGDDVVNVLRALGLDGMLQTDLGQMQTVQQQRADSPDSWRALLFPYWDDQKEQAKQGGFFWRRHHEEDADKAAPDEGSLRFVLNVEMSELGHTQLDGLMQEKSSLYLKVRTQYPLSQSEEQGLKQLVNKSLTALGLEGQVTTESSQFFDVDPLHDMLGDIEGFGPEKTKNQLNVEA